MVSNRGVVGHDPGTTDQADASLSRMARTGKWRRVNISPIRAFQKVYKIYEFKENQSFSIITCIRETDGGQGGALESNHYQEELWRWEWVKVPLDSHFNVTSTDNTRGIWVWNECVHVCVLGGWRWTKQFLSPWVLHEHVLAPSFLSAGGRKMWYKLTGCLSQTIKKTCFFLGGVLHEIFSA